MIISTPAIVLNARKYSESSKICSVYTRSNGLQSVIAKGSRRPKNKFGSSLDPLSHSFVTFYKNENRQLHTLSDAETITPFRQLYDNFDSLASGLMIAESVSQAQEENQENPQLFDHFVNWLKELNTCDENQFSIFVKSQIELIEMLGFGIDFENITHFSKESGTVFSIKNAEFIEHGNSHDLFVFDADSSSVMIDIATMDLSQASTVFISERSKTQIHNFFVNYFCFHLEKRFNYRTFNMMKK